MTFFLYHTEYSNVSADQFNIMKNDMPHLGIQFYYIIQDAGLSLIFFILMITFLPNFISSDFLEMSNSKYSHMILTRVDYNKKTKNELLITFFCSFILTILANILILLIINFFLFPIHLSTVEHIEPVYDLSTIFSNNQLISLFIYIILSACGYGVFSCFIYSLQVFIKNIYLYRAIGLFLGIILVIFPSFVSQILNIPVISSWIYFLSLWSIVTPGIGSTISLSPLILYLGSMTAYIFIISIILELKKRRYESYGE